MCGCLLFVSVSMLCAASLWNNSSNSSNLWSTEEEPFKICKLKHSHRNTVSTTSFVFSASVSMGLSSDGQELSSLPMGHSGAVATPLKYVPLVVLFVCFGQAHYLFAILKLGFGFSLAVLNISESGV